VKTKKSIGNYVLKTLVYLIFLLLLPLIIIALIVIGFKVFVLNESINIKPILLMIAKKMSQQQVEYEDDDYEVSEDDLIMVGVEDITNKKY
jgi:hypothetical protein